MSLQEQATSRARHQYPPNPPRPHLSVVRGRPALWVSAPTLFALDPYVTGDADADMTRDGYLTAYRGHTLDSYRTDLRIWFQWCRDRNLPVLDAKRSDIQTFAQHMEATGLKPATVGRRLTTVCGFYMYAEQEDIITKSPGRYVRRPRVPNESNSNYLDRYELGRFLITAERTSPRHAALASLLALNGLRVSEACNSSIEDLSFAVKGHQTLTVVRKGGREAQVPLAPRTVRNIVQAVGVRGTGPLLLDANGNRMTRDAASRAVRLIAKRADINKKIGPHALRHTFVSLGLDFGIPLRDMQTAAGHADPSTTTRYDRRERDLDRHAAYIVAAVVGN